MRIRVHNILSAYCTQLALYTHTHKSANKNLGQLHVCLMCHVCMHVYTYIHTYKSRIRRANVGMTGYRWAIMLHTWTPWHVPISNIFKNHCLIRQLATHSLSLHIVSGRHDPSECDGERFATAANSEGASWPLFPELLVYMCVVWQ